MTVIVFFSWHFIPTTFFYRFPFLDVTHRFLASFKLFLMLKNPSNSNLSFFKEGRWKYQLDISENRWTLSSNFDFNVYYLKTRTKKRFIWAQEQNCTQSGQSAQISLFIVAPTKTQKYCFWPSWKEYTIKY